MGPKGVLITKALTATASEKQPEVPPVEKGQAEAQAAKKGKKDGGE